MGNRKRSNGFWCPALTCAVVLHVATSARAQESPASSATPTVVASGEAIVRHIPDVAYVTLTVETRARSPREAQRQNAEAAAGVQRQIVNFGLSKDAQRTLGLSLEQEFDNVNGRRIVRDFVARNTLELRIDDVTRAGEIADGIVQAGATSLNGIRFDLKDRQAAEREALRAAVADARARADAAAAGAGRSIDRVLKIQDSRMDVGPPRPMPMMMRAADGAVSTPVEPGLIEIRALATITASMK
jgi:uncharacterized protein